uniref:Uncharacterized protein n=1 Tax=Cacopsylla melanoneura TaxID=428564 RepID=A0A8D8RFL4_9HEMI
MSTSLNQTKPTMSHSTNQDTCLSHMVTITSSQLTLEHGRAELVTRATQFGQLETVEVVQGFPLLNIGNFLCPTQVFFLLQFERKKPVASVRNGSWNSTEASTSAAYKFSWVLWENTPWTN